MLLDGAHLTYCTNVHPGETWVDTFDNLKKYLPAIKKEVSPEKSFGVGLRLSSQASNSLNSPETLEEFKDFLKIHDLYIFTINGFPYGDFHQKIVKENVYLPDWRDPKRLDYTNQLAKQLGQWLPENLMGSISTVPGAFKAHLSSPEDVETIAQHLIEHAAYLVALKEQTGKHICLGLEPEPCCFLETTDETVKFFKEHLFSQKAIKNLADLTSMNSSHAEEALHQHLGLCYDTCHLATQFENPKESLRKLQNAGIQISKVQLSAALSLPEVNEKSQKLLAEFDDGIYSHQVIEKNPQETKRFDDLPEAFKSLQGTPQKRQWRVHFHIPIFLEKFDELESTQPFLKEILAQHKNEPLSSHLEVETYTWNVLPKEHRNTDLTQAISRELNWVKNYLDD